MTILFLILSDRIIHFYRIKGHRKAAFLINQIVIKQHKNSNPANTLSFCLCKILLSKHLSLPGVDFEPGFCVRLRALMTSTSNWPFLSSIPICISPASGEEAKNSSFFAVMCIKKKQSSDYNLHGLDKKLIFRAPKSTLVSLLPNQVLKCFTLFFWY